MVDGAEFRATLGRFATGITVVTVDDRAEVRGITVNAFMSVSLEPPLIAICIAKTARLHGAFAPSRRFGVNILAQSQRSVSDHFAGRDAPAPELYRHLDVPLIEGALAHLVCAGVDAHEAGDHTLYVARVEHLDHQAKGRPLLYYAGAYRELDPEG